MSLTFLFFFNFKFVNLSDLYFLRSENKDLLVVKINPHKFFRFFEKCKNAQMVIISVQVQPWPASINVLFISFK
jgi:hypothetical protein